MRQRPVWMVVFFLALILVGYVAYSSGINVDEYERLDLIELREEEEDEEEEEEEEETFLPVSEPRDLDWFGNLVLIIAITPLALALLGFLYFLASGIIRFILNLRVTIERDPDQLATTSDTDEEEIVAEAIDASLADIDSGAAPRAAIIACWVTLEHAASELGIHRKISDTPLKLVERLLERRRINHSDTAALSDLYLAARYSTTELNEHQVNQARATLQSIRNQLFTEVVS